MDASAGGPPPAAVRAVEIAKPAEGVTSLGLGLAGDLLVKVVKEGSNAAKAGVRAGMRVVTVGDAAVTDREGYLAALESSFNDASREMIRIGVVLPASPKREPPAVLFNPAEGESRKIGAKIARAILDAKNVLDHVAVDDGLIVTSISPSSEALAAGMTVGSRIVSVNYASVRDKAKYVTVTEACAGKAEKGAREVCFEYTLPKTEYVDASAKTEKDGSPRERASSKISKRWQCRNCTVENSARAEACYICASPKKSPSPAHPSPSPPRDQQQQQLSPESEVRYRQLLRKTALGDVLTAGEHREMETLRGRFIYNNGTAHQQPQAKQKSGGRTLAPTASSSSGFGILNSLKQKASAISPLTPNGRGGEASDGKEGPHSANSSFCEGRDPPTSPGHSYADKRQNSGAGMNLLSKIKRHSIKNIGGGGSNQASAADSEEESPHVADPNTCDLGFADSSSTASTLHPSPGGTAAGSNSSSPRIAWSTFKKVASSRLRGLSLKEDRPPCLDAKTPSASPAAGPAAGPVSGGKEASVDADRADSGSANLLQSTPSMPVTRTRSITPPANPAAAAAVAQPPTVAGLPAGEAWSREEDNLLRHLQSKLPDEMSDEEKEQRDSLAARFEHFINDGLQQMEAAAAGGGASWDKKSRIATTLSKLYATAKEKARERQEATTHLFTPPPTKSADPSPPSEPAPTLTAYF